ncbi:ALQxL family class IV lanthipeptide [Kitasatospora azatica]|nr:ALQxL family class IV lanthipeptide [Kitasatospora azatica]
MELDLDALQELPAEDEQAAYCRFSCDISTKCPSSCFQSGGQ